jgi:CDGSH-type Zn-finger protein
MSEPEIAGTEPMEVELTVGRKYSFCTCGKSTKQPFCDGSHKGTAFTPHVFEAKEAKCWLCMCKRTGDRPYCDGSHNKLKDCA